jgi:hypothetical protein
MSVPSPASSPPTYLVDKDQVTRFLVALYDWDAIPRSESSPGWVNIHYIDPSQSDDLAPGWACKTLDRAISAVDRQTRLGWNVYCCPSVQSSAIQRMSQRTKRNYWGAIRRVQNTHSHRAIVGDFDGAKFGLDQRQTVDTVRRFFTENEFPEPDIWVWSGGGAHCYWLLTKSLTSVEWKPIAERVKKAVERRGPKWKITNKKGELELTGWDTPVIADAVHLFRVPGTFNHKYDPPQRVRLLRINGEEYVPPPVCRL